MEPYDPAKRTNEKIRRCRLKTKNVDTAARIVENMKTIGQYCRPCVVGACFRTMWNGWPTTARMRSMRHAAPVGQCVFGCHEQEDRIEHYLICNQVWEVISRRPPTGLGLRLERRNIESMLLAAWDLTLKEKLAAAIACYAVARTAACIRWNGDAHTCKVSLRLFMSEGLKGSCARKEIAATILH